VAIVAVVAAGDVCRVFAGRGNAVMTGAARAQYLGMIDHVRGRPNFGVVAIFANIRRLHVCQILASGIYAVMAADAVTNNIQVIEGCRSPSNGGVTVVAGVATGDVRRVFADRNNAVVTRAARANHLRMVNGKYRREDVCVVAVFTDICCLNMRLILADGVHAVMAVDAGADDVDMIEVRR